MPKIREEWYVIVNPRAGSGKTMSEWVPAENHMKNIGVKYYTVYTTHKHHANELAAAAARQGYRKILAVGGDGSIHEVFDGVVDWCFSSGTDPEEFYLAVAPIGSGNDWIKSFGVPHDTKDVVELIAKDSFTTQDIVGITLSEGRTFYMANIAGLGFDSHVCERVNFQKERGKRSKRIYLTALFYTLHTCRAINLEVNVDGETIFSGKCYSISIGNGKYSGGGLRQTSLAETCDGLVDCMVVPKVSIFSLLVELPRLFKGTIHETDKVVYARGKNIKIIPLDGQSEDLVEIDGEVEGRMPLEVNVTGRHINVLAGKNHNK